MKKNNDTPTLEQLLQSVEHAGRDHRRQQQLAQMIDQMADAEQSRRRTVRLWSARLAVAATITLFVVIPVWKWIAPSHPDGPQLAEALPLRHSQLPVPRPLSPVPSRSAGGLKPRTASSHPAPQPVSVAPEDNSAAVQPAPIAPDESLAAEPVLLPEPTVEEVAVAEPLPAIADTAAETIPSQAAPSQPQPDQMAEASAEPRRQSFFSFLNAEPSLMDGTMLAFNIL